MPIFVTTFSDSDADETFIRVNQSLNGAWIKAIDDLKISFDDYACTNGDKEIDCVEGEDGQPCVLRIINPNSGYEYEAFIITETEVGE